MEPPVRGRRRGVDPMDHRLMMDATQPGKPSEIEAIHIHFERVGADVFV